MAPSTTIAAFAVLALMPAGLLAFPTSFIREHSGTACFYTKGMFVNETKIMGNVPKVVADCSSNCCIKDAPAKYDAGKEYTLTVTNGVGHHMVGTSSGSIADANCKSAGKTYQGKNNAQTVKWTAPAAGTGGVEIGVTCGSGYSEPVFAFATTIKEAPTTTLKRKAITAPVSPVAPTSTKAITTAIASFATTLAAGKVKVVKNMTKIKLSISLKVEMASLDEAKAPAILKAVGQGFLNKALGSTCEAVCRSGSTGSPGSNCYWPEQCSTAIRGLSASGAFKKHAWYYKNGVASGACSTKPFCTTCNDKHCGAISGMLGLQVESTLTTAAATRRSRRAVNITFMTTVTFLPQEAGSTILAQVSAAVDVLEKADPKDLVFEIEVIDSSGKKVKLSVATQKVSATKTTALVVTVEDATTPATVVKQPRAGASSTGVAAVLMSAMAAVAMLF